MNLELPPSSMPSTLILSTVIAEPWGHLFRGEFCVVYFARAGATNQIKIGSSIHADNRLQQLQCGNALKLNVLATYPGNRQTERFLQEAFAADRILLGPDVPGQDRHEWFTDSARMMWVVRGLNKASLRLN